MKISILILFTLLTLQSWAQTPTINSIETLKHFMQDGQKNGYFPQTLTIGFPLAQNKLMAVDLDFREVIYWDVNTQCPNQDDEIILALGRENHSIVCDRGDTAGILGSGDDWIKDATGNDIYYPGPGNDTIDVGSGSDIVIFDAGWGHDTLTIDSRPVDTSKILGYDGSYPWKYSDFIIFGSTVKRSDIVWLDESLYNLQTGDSIKLNTKKINILFASEKVQGVEALSTRYKLKLTDIKAESIVHVGDYLYLAKGNNGIEVASIDDHNNLTTVSTLVLPGRAMSMVIKDKIAYIAQGDYYLEGKRGWVSIVDLHQPSQPKLLTTLKFGTIIRQVIVHDNILYVPSTHYWKKDRRHLYIYDVQDTQKPKLLTKHFIKDHINPMVYFNDRLYYSAQHDYLKAVDISIAKVPKLVAPKGFNSNKAYNLVVKDDLLLVTGKDHRISLYEATKDQAVEFQCSWQTLQQPLGHDFTYENSILFRGDLIYKAESKYGITVSSMRQCRSVAHFPVKEGKLPWPTKLININEKLISFNQSQRPTQVYQIKKNNLYPIDGNLQKRAGTKKIKLSQDQLQSALYDASVHGNRAEVKRLLTLGANPNVKGHQRYTPVEIAARVGELDALEVLLKGGAKPTRNAMMLAALTEQEAVMKLLERYGVPVTVSDKERCTTLHYIAQDGSLEMVKYLINKGVPYNATCRKEETPLKWANYGNNCEVIDYLEGLYPTGYAHQPNEVCLKRKEQARIEAQKRKETLAIAKAHERVVDGKTFSYQPLKIRFKAKLKGDQLNIKAMVHNPMDTVAVAQKYRKPPHFLTHVMISVKEHLLYDATLSPYLSKNPIFKAKFTYKEKLDTSPVIAVRDNAKFSAKAKVSRLHKIKRDPFSYKVDDSHDYRVLKPAVWSAIGIDDATRAFYGAVDFQEGGFKIVTPKVAANGGSIPLHVESKLELESMLVLATGNHHSAVIAYHIPLGQKPNYDFKIKVRESGNKQIIVVAKGRDGKYYKSSHHYELAGPPTCDGS